MLRGLTVTWLLCLCVWKTKAHLHASTLREKGKRRETERDMRDEWRKREAGPMINAPSHNTSIGSGEHAVASRGNEMPDRHCICTSNGDSQNTCILYFLCVCCVSVLLLSFHLHNVQEISRSGYFILTARKCDSHYKTNQIGISQLY